MTNWKVTPRQRSADRPSGRVDAPTPLDVLALGGPTSASQARTLALPRWLTASTTLDVLSHS